MNNEQVAQTRFMLGDYEGGTLWGIRSRTILLMLFNDTAIARRSQDKLRSKWMALDLSWQVRSLPNGKVWVQRSGHDRVVVSIPGHIR